MAKTVPKQELNPDSDKRQAALSAPPEYSPVDARWSPARTKALGAYLSEIGSIDRTIWQRVDALRAARGQHADSWPEWCFLPRSAVARLAAEFPAVAPMLARFEGLAAWRPTQGVYVFDPFLVDELSRTSDDEPVPGKVLLQMPEWCLYLTAAGGKLGAWGLRGCFAFLSCDDADRPLPALRLLLEMNDGSLLATLPISLSGDSVNESIEQAYADARELAGRANGLVSEVSGSHRSDYSRALAPLVNLVVYI